MVMMMRMTQAVGLAPVLNALGRTRLGGKGERESYERYVGF